MRSARRRGRVLAAGGAEHVEVLADVQLDPQLVPHRPRRPAARRRMQLVGVDEGQVADQDGHALAEPAGLARPRRRPRDGRRTRGGTVRWPRRMAEPSITSSWISAKACSSSNAAPASIDWRGRRVAAGADEAPVAERRAAAAWPAPAAARPWWRRRRRCRDRRRPSAGAPARAAPRAAPPPRGRSRPAPLGGRGGGRRRRRGRHRRDGHRGPRLPAAGRIGDSAGQPDGFERRDVAGAVHVDGLVVADVPRPERAGRRDPEQPPAVGRPHQTCRASPGTTTSAAWWSTCCGRPSPRP